jgi:hypothetical protein
MSQIAEIPRPLLVALIGAVAVGALLFATSRGGTKSSTPTVQSAKPATPASKAHAGKTAQPSAKRSESSGAAPHKATIQGLPAPVGRAVAADKVVVMLFWNPRSTDDRAVKAALAGVSTRHGAVAKFTDTLPHFSRYTRLTGQNVVTQTPTVLVLDKHKQVKTATGYLDTATVDQLVVDALRAK